MTMIHILKSVLVGFGVLLGAPAIGAAGPAQRINPDNVFVLQGRPWQETTTSPLTLIFQQTRVTVPATDIDQRLTVMAREIVMANQSAYNLRVQYFAVNVVQRSYQQTTTSPWTLTLASGTVITIPASAVNDMLTGQLRMDLHNGTARTAPTPEPEPVATATTSSVSTRAKCARDWPDDFQMRAYCERKERENAEALGRRSMTSADEQTIRAKCSREWPDDFMMRNYCEEQQLKALRSLR